MNINNQELESQFEFGKIFLFSLLILIIAVFRLEYRYRESKKQTEKLNQQCQQKQKKQKDSSNLNCQIINPQNKYIQKKTQKDEQKNLKLNQISYEQKLINQIKENQDCGNAINGINNFEPSFSSQPNQSQLKESQEEQILQPIQQVNVIQSKQEDNNNSLENIQVEQMKNQITGQEILFKSEQYDSQNALSNANKQQELDQSNENSINSAPQQNQSVSSLKKQNNSLVSQLYNLTIHQRYVEAQYRAFVNEELNVNELVREYGMGVLRNKKTLSQQLRGMRNVRGDGNCFYTAFVFQFLQQIIGEENDIFKRFIQSIKELKFQITYKDLQIAEEQLEVVKSQFIQTCEEIRETNESDRMTKLCQYFKDDQNEFYGQSIIFIRSLTFQICDTEETRQLFQAQGLDLKSQLLEWEQDCESNELIIQKLSQFLNLKIILFFCNNKDKSVELREFNDTQNPKQTIYLLLRPGHYCIGLPKNN